MSEMPKDIGTPGFSIEQMFSLISPRYDLINHLASMGIDRCWRNRAAKAVAAEHGASIIDLCCGTGDLAFALAAYTDRSCKITGVDFSQAMLQHARQKEKQFQAAFPNRTTSFTWMCGDCTRLDFPERSFDAVTCAFGLRNIPNFRAVLRESFRVLRTGGSICILEFSLPKSPLIATIYLFYFRHLLWRLAGFVSGQPQAYRYFVQSVCRWNNDIDMEHELKTAGFRDIKTNPMTWGVAALYVAKKLDTPDGSCRF